VAPIVAMLRHAMEIGATDLFTPVVAARTIADLPFADEFIGPGATIVLSRQDYRARAAGWLSAADLKPSMARDTPATCAALLDSPSRPGNCWWRWASMSAASGSKDSGSAGGDGRGSTACLFGRRRTDERAPWRHDVPRPA